MKNEITRYGSKQLDAVFFCIPHLMFYNVLQLYKGVDCIISKSNTAYRVAHWYRTLRWVGGRCSGACILTCSTFPSICPRHSFTQARIAAYLSNTQSNVHATSDISAFGQQFLCILVVTVDLVRSLHTMRQIQQPPLWTFPVMCEHWPAIIDAACNGVPGVATYRCEQRKQSLCDC